MSQAAPPIPTQADDATDSEAQLLALEKSIDTLLVEVEKAVVTSDSIDQAVAQAAEALPTDFMAIDDAAGHEDSAAAAQASLEAALQDAQGSKNAAAESAPESAPEPIASAPAAAPQNELEASIEEALAQAQLATQQPAAVAPTDAPASASEREELAGLAELDAKLAELAELETHDEAVPAPGASGALAPGDEPALRGEGDSGAAAIESAESSAAPSEGDHEGLEPDALDAAEAMGVSAEESAALNAAPASDAASLAPSSAPAPVPSPAPITAPARAATATPEPAATTVEAEAEPSGPGLVTRVGGMTVRAMAWPLTLLPTEARDAVGWLALVTLFNAACLWVFVLMRGA
jgi:hypothetical protein